MTSRMRYSIPASRSHTFRYSFGHTALGIGNEIHDTVFFFESAARPFPGCSGDQHILRVLLAASRVPRIGATPLGDTARVRSEHW